MEYRNTVLLKDGRTCILRNGTEADGQQVFDNFNLTHGETDFLLTYPEETSFNAEQESDFLKEKSASNREIEIVAVVDKNVVGTAGIEAVGNVYKLRHRAEFGVSVAKEYWGIGIGRALMNACIECAAQAGYSQLELNVVAENERAIAMYKSADFVEFGRNPKGFCSKLTGYQEVVYMYMEL